MTHIKKFGLLFINNSKFIKFNTDIDRNTDEQSCANMILKLALREEGFEWNINSVVKYLQGWADHMNENEFDGRTNHEIRHITDYIADYLISSNSLHIIRLSDRVEVSNEFRRDVCSSIERILTKSIEKGFN
jgi:hypothetical protein